MIGWGSTGGLEEGEGGVCGVGIILPSGENVDGGAGGDPETIRYLSSSSAIKDTRRQKYSESGLKSRIFVDDFG